MFKVLFKLLIVGCFFSMSAFAFTTKTFPIGLHSLQKAKIISPDHKEALVQASCLVGRVLSTESEGTAYLFYNQSDKTWEVHSAYHVVEDEVKAALPLVLELKDETLIALDHNKIVSSDDEHKNQDRVRYAVDYSGEVPDKINFLSSGSIDSGSSLVVVGHPYSVAQTKFSFGHSIIKNVKGYWLSTATAQSGSSGSMVLTLEDDGTISLAGTAVIVENVSPFMMVSYTVDDRRLPSVLSTMDFNAWIIEVSNPNKSPIQSELENRMFFSGLLLPYISRIDEYPKDNGAWYQLNYLQIIQGLKNFLELAKLRVELEPHAAANDIKEGIVEYFSRVDGDTTKINIVDFPLLTQEQLFNISPNDLKLLLNIELDRSMTYLDKYSARLDNIVQLFAKDSLKEVITHVRDLNILDNEQNFEQYNIPMMSYISTYNTD